MNPADHATAFHEAGHAVVALALGGKIKSVEIGSEPLTHCLHRRGTTHAAVVALAGGLAERRAEPWGLSWGDRIDRQCAREVAERLAPADPLGQLQIFLDQAEALLDRHWREVEAVAAALLRRGKLTGQEIDDLVRY